MGATTFSQRAQGASAKEAFAQARDHASWEHGHGGYTGTIAEKHEFIMLPVPEGVDQSTDWYEYDPDCPHWQAVDDKWGPAGCFDLGDGHFLFFGWASS